MIDGDELSIFPDQTAFLERLDRAGRRGVLNIPGTCIEVTPDSLDVTHPVPIDDVRAIFDDKRSYLAPVPGRLEAVARRVEGGWDPPSTDLVATLQEWWEPLLDMAPTLRGQVGANVLLRAGRPRRPDRLPRRRGARRTTASRTRSASTSPASSSRPSSTNAPSTGATRCSCRAGSPRGATASSTSTSTTSSSRCRASACGGPRPRSSASSTPTPEQWHDDEPDIRLGDYLVQRRCPHRNADLAAFGLIDGDELVCTLHGWRFDLATGRCLTASDQPIRITTHRVNVCSISASN